MAKLTATKRKAMPRVDFAGPHDSFPDNDAEHARLAISGATRSARAGNISPTDEAKIKANARSRLAKLDGKAGEKAKKVPRGDGLAKHARDLAKRWK